MAPRTKWKGSVGDLTTKLERMRRCAIEDHHDVAPSLVHAYANCLTDDEVCLAITLVLPDDIYLRGVIRTQLITRAIAGLVVATLDRVAADLIAAGEATPKHRVRSDAILSELYKWLSPPTREQILAMWLARGRPGAESRWLHAITGDELLFSLPAILTYWRSTGDSRAAKLLAERSAPETLPALILEMLARNELGASISRAMLRASTIPEHAWPYLRHKYPATFAYVCAMTGRPIEEADAYAIIRSCEPDHNGARGLAIWSVGKLGMWAVLERVHSGADRDRRERERNFIKSLATYVRPSE